MRRIYESDALHRDDDEPHSPRERRRSEAQPASFRSLPSGTLSRVLVPTWLRHRAVSVAVTTPREEFAVDEAVPFRVEMYNAAPFPVTIRTRSPVLWTWNVDGAEGASWVEDRAPPDGEGAFEFGRGERKRFLKHWPQRFRVSESEWEPAEPGTYVVGAGINVDDAEGTGLYDETTVRIVED